MGESGEQVGVDLGQPLELVGVGSEQRAAQAGVFVLAGCGVGASADPEFDFAFLGVGEELVPLVVGDVAVFLAGSQGSAAGDERPVVFDYVRVVDGDVTLGGVETLVAEKLGGDVDRQTEGDGFGGEDPPEVMRREPGRCPIPRG